MFINICETSFLTFCVCGLVHFGNDPSRCFHSQFCSIIPVEGRWISSLKSIIRIDHFKFEFSETLKNDKIAPLDQPILWLTNIIEKYHSNIDISKVL